MGASVPGRSLPSHGRPAPRQPHPIERQELYAYVAYVLTSRFVQVPALMSLLGSENHDCPELISLKSPQYMF